MDTTKHTFGTDPNDGDWSRSLSAARVATPDRHAARPERPFDVDRANMMTQSARTSASGPSSDGTPLRSWDDSEPIAGYRPHPSSPFSSLFAPLSSFAASYPLLFCLPSSEVQATSSAASQPVQAEAAVGAISIGLSLLSTSASRHARSKSDKDPRTHGEPVNHSAVLQVHRKILRYLGKAGSATGYRKLCSSAPGFRELALYALRTASASSPSARVGLTVLPRYQSSSSEHGAPLRRRMRLRHDARCAAFAGVALVSRPLRSSGSILGVCLVQFAVVLSCASHPCPFWQLRAVVHHVVSPGTSWRCGGWRSTPQHRFGMPASAGSR